MTFPTRVNSIIDRIGYKPGWTFINAGHSILIKGLLAGVTAYGHAYTITEKMTDADIIQLAYLIAEDFDPDFDPRAFTLDGAGYDPPVEL